MNDSVRSGKKLDSMVDHNKIGDQIKLIENVKIFRLGTILILISFVVGAFWEVLV